MCAGANKGSFAPHGLPREKQGGGGDDVGHCQDRVGSIRIRFGEGLRGGEEGDTNRSKAADGPRVKSTVDPAVAARIQGCVEDEDH